MSDEISHRKYDHIRIIRADGGSDRSKSYFDAIALQHHALPEIDLKNIDPGIEFLGKSLSFPLMIAPMTGGDHDLVRTINKNLARAAEATQVAMAVGSQRVMITHPAARESFSLRPLAPHAVLIGNLGAVQLNYGFGLKECLQAIEVLDADGLYLHLNPLQEAIQPEGETNFSGLAAKIGAVAAALPRPLLLKEVGSGISRRDAELLIRHGIRYIDAAGSGGTSWSRIEHFRQQPNRGAESSQTGLLFQDWGLPTPALLEQLEPLRDRVTLIASGGIRSGLDMAKAMILGASLCGIAKPFLEPALRSADEVIHLIERLRREYVITLFLLGITRSGELIGNRSLLA
ncbi:MAG TPA: type 2 isopentenyl-diphosphate Delta-isomerase [bacterium]|nr:type 2 isopentenyl-diphosphate Delta-isomerase [bacterium]HPR87625.1 type 2 isopentenyl-diphosphate Delta-isomerase [bacterium]